MSETEIKTFDSNKVLQVLQNVLDHGCILSYFSFHFWSCKKYGKSLNLM